MKILHPIRRPHPHRLWRAQPAVPPAERRGSVLLVVVSLLGMLLLAGIVFYTFAAQENISAEYYSEEAKVISDPELDAESLFQFALQQLIMGPDDSLQHSALWGRRHSMVTNMFGFGDTRDIWDSTPFNGNGINLGMNLTTPPGGPPRGVPFVDQDYDNEPDADQTLLNINDSPPANNLTGNVPPLNLLASDVPFTSPDINTLFLAYKGGTPTTIGDVSVIIPSFVRPWLLRDPTSGNPIQNWWEDTSLTQKVLSPHFGHLAASGIPRYIRPTETVTNVNGDPVPPFPFPTANTTGIWSGNWLPGTTPNYEWDVDNDGDLIREGVWMDLDFPVQELSDGRLYLPLFSFTVYDADGLLNLNHAGNVAGATNAAPYGNGDFISRSNQGLSRSEINPLWALHADPNSSTYTTNNATDLQQHRTFWQLDNGDPISRTDMANMELLFSRWGRPQFKANASGSFNHPAGMGGPFTPDTYTPGLWGELGMLQSAVASLPAGGDFSLFPRPGQSFVDDDADINYGKAYTDSQTGLVIPGFVHPVDLIGNGSSYNATGNGLQAALFNPGGGNPVRWLNYVSGYQDSGSYSTSGHFTYADANGIGSYSLHASRTTEAGKDEADETVSEPGLALSNNAMINDDVFKPNELMGLHLSNSDLLKVGGASRLRNLLPFNFQLNNRASDIRQQFTVVSNDRAQFGYDRPRPGIRPGELSADFDEDGHFDFPPQFGSVPIGSAADPFRLELRAHFAGRVDNEMRTKRSFRLDVNRLLSGFDSEGNPIFRKLTPHPAQPTQENTAVTTLPDSVAAAGWPPTTIASREFWARRDRQQLARDIYVLLYTLGGGKDGMNYATTSNAPDPISGERPLYSNSQLEEMAQFAVNYVDAMDPDSVITKFEYDRDLSNGWNLGDNAYTTSDDTVSNADPNDPLSERGVVYGVEHQQLTLSETLAIRQPSMSSNHSATLYNDMDENPHYYIYVEMRNAGPFPVSLDYGTWRLRRLGADRANPDPNEPDPSDLTVRIGNPTGTVSVGAVNPGATFTIGSSDGNDRFPTGEHRPSDFRVDYDFDGTYNLIAPALPDPTPPTSDTDVTTFPGPMTNLDLVHARDQNKFTLEGGTRLLDVNNDAGDFVIRLERRLHPGLPALNEIDNPWITVDLTTVSVRDFQLSDGDSMANDAIRLMRLPPLTSRERATPLQAASGLQEPAYAGPSAIRRNTIGATNSQPASTDVWQPHFDRDLTSVLDLLSVPLFNPRTLTQMLVNASGRLQGDNTAAVRFLRPGSFDTPNPATDNRWYRILEFLEVPTRTHLSIRGDLEGPRLPAAINPNTIRHRGVLAGLIDDPDDPNTAEVDGHLNVNYTNVESMLRDRYESNRDWWMEFISARDGMDPISTLLLPGIPGARPFRSLTYVNEGNESIQSTILRSLPSDGDDNARRGLFEARTQTDAAGGPSGDLVDYHTRQRILRKIANNTTPRSNTFIVFVSTDFFEVVRVDDGAGGFAYRIGGKLDSSSVPHRGFFVIDRSLPEATYNREADLFDYKKFILFGKTIQ